MLSNKFLVLKYFKFNRKRMKRLIAVLHILASFYLCAEDIEGYKKPPVEILELVDVQRAPRSIIDDKGEKIFFLYRDSYKSIAQLSENELRLAGLRVNPVTNISSRITYYNNIKFKAVSSKGTVQVSGLPDKPRIANFSWSPDQTLAAFTHTTIKGVELWIVSINDLKARKLTNDFLNANLGGVYRWYPDSSALLVKKLPDNRKPLIETSIQVPTGPAISVSKGGKARNRTYQDLLKNDTDKFNFELLATSEIIKVNLKGKVENFLQSAMYRGISWSPDGNYIKVTRMKRPFSTIVTYGRFPYETVLFNKLGEELMIFDKSGLLEELPKGFMSVKKGKRKTGPKIERGAVSCGGRQFAVS